MSNLILGTCALATVVGGLSMAWHEAAPAMPDMLPVVVAASPPPRVLTPSKLAELRATRDRLVSQIVARRPAHTAPPAASGPTTVGTLDPEYVRKAIADLLPLFQQCLEDGLDDHPGMQGLLLLRFTISADPQLGGVVSDSSVDPTSTLQIASVSECFEQTIYAARLPAPTNGGDIVVTYPFILTPDDDTALPEKLPVPKYE